MSARQHGSPRGRATGLDGLPQPAGIVDAATEAAWTDLECYLQADGAKPRTIERYGWSLVKLARWLDDPARSLLELGHQDLNAYLAWLADCGGRDGKPSTPSTVDTHNRALRRIWKYWHRAGYVEVDPMALVALPPVPEIEVPVVAEVDREAWLASCASASFADRRDAAMYRLLEAPGGPRASELCGIELADVDMRAGTVLLRNTKGRQPRLIPMGPLARQALLRYQVARARHRLADRTPALFIGKYGPITRDGLRTILRKRAELAGAGHVYPHKVRHTSAAKSKAGGMSEQTMEILYGWKPGSKMQRRYGAAAAKSLAIAQGLELAARIER